MKNSITIARFSASEGFSSNNPRYRIDRSTFALIISSVDMTDSGEGYQCDVYIRNPSGANNDQLPSNNGSITLDIHGEFYTSHEQRRCWHALNDWEILQKNDES